MTVASFLHAGGLKGIFSSSIVRKFSTTQEAFKENLKSARKFKPSSQQWLFRQINDQYVKQAKLDHYRCRSAFKLLEIDKSYSIFKPGQTVVDLGCAPGSWTQVAVKATKADIPNSKSLVVGIDLSPIHPIEGATLLSAMDFTSDIAQQRLVDVLGARSVNVLLSDMAPHATGIKSMDHINVIKLCYAALTFAERTCCSGSSVILKVFDGGECAQLLTYIKSLFHNVSIIRPDASRKNSSEMFYVCLKFKGRQTNC